MEEKERISMMYHHYSHYLARAFSVLTHKGPQQADELRLELVDKLKELGASGIVEKCIQLLQDCEWKSAQQLEQFQTDYQKLQAPSN